MKDDEYLGQWALIPELCLYQQGEPPLSGSYTMTEAEGVIHIAIDWLDRQEQRQQVAFSAPAEGQPQAVDAPGLSHMTLTRIDSCTLDSSAYDGEREVMYARRVAHDDLLTTVQTTTTADGSFSLFQVYRRVVN